MKSIKEKFSQLLPFYNVNDNNNKSIQCEKIADEFAIEFAEWVEKLRDSDIDSLDYAFWLDNTAKELLEIFKKEKRL
jgi:hypothetical protein